MSVASEMERQGIDISESYDLYLDLLENLIDVQIKNGKLAKSIKALDGFAGRFFFYYNNNYLLTRPVDKMEEWKQNIGYQARGWLLNQ